MALYKHMANKQELLEDMVALVWNEVTVPDAAHGWKQGISDRASPSGTFYAYGLALQQKTLSLETPGGVC